MVLATLFLVCAVSLADEPATAAVASNGNAERQALSATAAENSSKEVSVLAALPSAPEPKVNPAIERASFRSAAQPFQPVRPVTRPVETPRQRKMWFGLMAASHAGAGFDAWSTRRAISSGGGQEANPFMKPFANSNAIYAATQVSPAFMDFLGKRMMVSQNPWIRKLWWVPQVAGTSVSFAAGAHNLGVAR